MCKFPYLALSRLNSPKLAYSRHCQVDTNFNGRDPFNQTSDWSDWKWSTWKVDQFFRNFSYRIDPMSFETKFSEVLIEWMAPEYLTAHCSSKPTSKRLLRRLVSHSTSMQIFFLQRLKRLLNQRWRFSDVYIRHDKRCISSNLQNYPKKQRVTS